MNPKVVAITEALHQPGIFQDYLKYKHRKQTETLGPDPTIEIFLEVNQNNSPHLRDTMFPSSAGKLLSLLDDRSR